LQLAERLVNQGEHDVETIRRDMLEQLSSVGVDDVQYIAFVADGTVSAVRSVEGPTTVAIAAIVGATRLIDNLCIG
jgi:pantothenate synthetase